MTRWQYTKYQRNFKCSFCFCLLSSSKKCLNDKCYQFKKD